MSYNSSNRQPRLYRLIDEINWRIHRSGFLDGFIACLMVVVFSALIAFYLVAGLV
jgi:hypothetical protein